MIAGTATAARDQRARSSFSASALFSEHLRGAVHSVKRDYCFSKFTCKYSRNHSTGIVLSCVYYFISSDNGSIKLEIRIFVQTSFLEGRAGYVFLEGCVSVTILYLSR